MGISKAPLVQYMLYNLQCTILSSTGTYSTSQQLLLSAVFTITMTDSAESCNKPVKARVRWCIREILNEDVVSKRDKA